MSPKSKAEAIKKQLVVFNELLKKPENKYCADCKKTTPTWASVNLGVFVCINCSGCHREIGVHITKIRSTNLDVWPKDILNNFKLINNQIANKYWECKLKNFDFKKIQNDKYKLVEFIRNKYEYKKWVDPNKKMDPMTLIMKGKIKKYKSLYCPSEGEEEEEEENEKKINKTKKIKKDKNIKNAKSEKKGEEGIPTLYIILISAFGFIMLIIILILIRCYLKTRQNKSNEIIEKAKTIPNEKLLQEM